MQTISNHRGTQLNARQRNSVNRTRNINLYGANKRSLDLVQNSYWSKSKTERQYQPAELVDNDKLAHTIIQVENREFNKLARVSTYNGFVKWNKIFKKLNEQFYAKRLDSPRESKIMLSKQPLLPVIDDASLQIKLLKQRPCFVKKYIDKKIMNKYRGQIASKCSVGKMEH
jgi:hypothetical protein